MKATPCPSLVHAHAFADDELPVEEMLSLLPHFARCQQCSEAIGDALLIREKLGREGDTHELAEAVVEVVRAAVDLVKDTVEDAAWWALRTAVRAVMPPPVKEWIRWQGGSVRWRNR